MENPGELAPGDPVKQKGGSMTLIVRIVTRIVAIMISINTRKRR
jgi:hypothetical protein